MKQAATEFSREFLDARETRVAVRSMQKEGEEPKIWIFTGGRDVLLTVEEAERLAADLNSFALKAKLAR